MSDTTREQRMEWMTIWCAKNGLKLQLEGECGIGRECVGVLADRNYPAYEWHNDDTYEREDQNGAVWTPEDAYHKSPCVAVLGRGDAAEEQLYEWLRWFDANGFKVETGKLDMDPRLGAIGLVLGCDRYCRMVRSQPA